MCGRYAVLRSIRDQQWSDLFSSVQNAAAAFDGVPRYNAAPMQHLPVLSVRDGKLRADTMLWWLIPHGAKDGKPLVAKDGAPFKTFNAKSETLDTSRLYLPYFKSARCLVPADAFYEWKRLDAEGEGKKPVKQPMAVRMKDERPFMFAGLFSVWRGEEGEERPSFTIITTEPNELMAKIHRRMPVILKQKDYEQWLDRENKDIEKLKKLLKPFAAKEMQAYPVSTVVSNSRNDVPECLTPLGTEGPAPKTAGARRSPKH